MKYGLKHGLARKPDENEILASAEALWDQIAMRNGFNLVNMEGTQIYRDKKKVIWKLKAEVVLLNPDKGNDMVIMDIKDNNESINYLFSDRTKFKIIKEALTFSRMTTLQNYIRKLKKQGQINDAKYKILYPKNAKIGWAHGSAKTQRF